MYYFNHTDTRDDDDGGQFSTTARRRAFFFSSESKKKKARLADDRPVLLNRTPGGWNDLFPKKELFGKRARFGRRIQHSNDRSGYLMICFLYDIFIKYRGW